MKIPIDGGVKTLFADLGAEKVIGAQKGNERIAVEIKTFQGSILSNFHEALGQYLDYRDALKEQNDDRKVYLGIPDVIYEEMTEIPFVIRRIKQYDLKLVLVHIENEIITQWIN